VRVRDLLAGGSKSCKSCAMRIRMAGVPKEVRVAVATKASVAAAKTLAKTMQDDPLRAQFGDAVVVALHKKGISAKQRCTNENNVGHKNYGGRGIKFMFLTPRAFAEWVLVNLGPPPTTGHSLDRIDNDRHYEPGNLRWATRLEQARNRRAYKRSAAGERIRTLQKARPDLTYETLRMWIKQGAADDEILQRRKHARTSV
jgi:hypothetical protein